MAFVSTQSASLDEIVFENRNQTYGAFRIRKLYHQHVILALWLTIGICAAFIQLPGWLSRTHIVMPSIPEKKGPEITLNYQSPVIEPFAKPKAKSQVGRNTANFPPVATSDLVDEQKLPEQTLTSTGSTTGVGNADDISLDLPGNWVGEGETVPTTTKANTPDVWLSVEQMPEFVGGVDKLSRYLNRTLHYPEIAQQNRVEGKVFVQFTVARDGKITDITVIKGLSKECDEEAVRVVKEMPDWKPGRQNGVAVPVRFVFPINFRLSN